MKTRSNLVRQNISLVKRLYPGIRQLDLRTLRDLTNSLSLSISQGEILYIEGRWYVTHAGLLRVAFRRKCMGISTTLQEGLSDPLTNRWVFKAVVYKSRGSRGFVGYGDADPANVSLSAAGAELRIAETRAVNRALRKAYAVGLCSVEELGSFSRGLQPKPPQFDGSHTSASNVSGGNGQPRLRDQLCLVVRKFNLDPTLVKAYAADFCGTETLSGASRDLVESFISHLSASATQNRDALVCKLNSYSRPQEATL